MTESSRFSLTLKSHLKDIEVEQYEKFIDKELSSCTLQELESIETQLALSTGEHKQQLHKSLKAQLHNYVDVQTYLQKFQQNASLLSSYSANVDLSFQLKSQDLETINKIASQLRNCAFVSQNFNGVKSVLNSESELRALLANQQYDQFIRCAQQYCALLTKYTAIQVFQVQLRQGLINVLGEFSALLQDELSKEDLSLQQVIRCVNYLSSVRQLKLNGVHQEYVHTTYLKARLNFFKVQWQKLKLEQVQQSLSSDYPQTDGDQGNQYQGGTDQKSNSIQSVRSPASSISIHQSSESKVLKQFIDFCRSFTLDIISVYMAIFTQTSITSQSQSSKDGKQIHEEDDNDDGYHFNQNVDSILKDPESALCLFLHHLLRDVICPELKTLLDNADSFAIISQSLTQSMHFGVALSRKGFDARWLFLPIYYDKILQLFNQNLDDIVAKYSEFVNLFGYRNFTVAVQSGAGGNSLNLEQLKESCQQCSLTAINFKSSGADMLQQFPVLAALSNDYLVLFNAIRNLLFVKLHSSMQRSVQQSLDKIGAVKVEQSSPSSSKDQEDMQEIVNVAIKNVFTPYIQLAFKQLWNIQ
ncbi:hypothetical protein MIR68_011620 [Amoeboaphelidium protococcarum]|nr:hypothetical protein MIR68_011620 [Amoeboaphelidium protococcarum]